MKNLYLNRYAWKQALADSYRLECSPDIIVVIPAYKENHIELTLSSLDNCEFDNLAVLVLVIVNAPEGEMVYQENQACLNQLNQFRPRNFQLIYHEITLPKKKAGVGLARKIGMDEAVRYFEEQGTQGIIACFDADSTCDPNYLLAIRSFFDENKELGLVYYEHPLDHENQPAILQYELYLRYYTGALRFTGFPYAYQTLGSCITVTSKAYQKYGGMNTRQAGEDFYFINKIAMHRQAGEINGTRIIPSPRKSDRVPFGTGHAVTKIGAGPESYRVYDPLLFEVIRDFLESVLGSNDLNHEYLTLLEPFLKSINTSRELDRIRNKSSSQDQFDYHFFEWFDAFKMLKLVHFLQESKFPPVPLQQALGWLDGRLWKLKISRKSPKEQLLAIRQWDRKNPL